MNSANPVRVIFFAEADLESKQENLEEGWLGTMG